MSMPAPIPRTSRSIHPGMLVFVGMLVIAMLGAAWFALWRKALTSATEARLKAIHAAGEPVTARELNAWYREVPAAHNAALAWTEGVHET
jgi:hypothetical protein